MTTAEGGDTKTHCRIRITTIYETNKIKQYPVRNYRVLFYFCIKPYGGGLVKDLLTHDKEFRYQLLDRLKLDCEYYLGHGNRYPKNLWALDEKE
jgi:hypothetical protein